MSALVCQVKEIGSKPVTFEHRKYEMKWDVAENWAWGFQDSASPIMEKIVEFHNYVMIYMTIILVGVFYMLGRIIVTGRKEVRWISHRELVHGTLIETIWTIIPAVILVLIGIPSIKLLYMMDEVIEPGITVKVVGHQWYWSYEYSDYVGQSGATINYDSYMIATSDLEEGDLRLLEVDNRLVLPVDTHVRVIVTAADVIHSWAIPSLGIKIDGTPGRLNMTGLLANREGVYYGQCSEICGTNHAFMPIVVEIVKMEDYCNYIESELAEA